MGKMKYHSTLQVDSVEVLQSDGTYADLPTKVDDLDLKVGEIDTILATLNGDEE